MNDIKHISNELINNGIYIFPEPMANKEQIRDIIEIHKNRLDPDDGSYQFGRAGRIGPISNWKGTAIDEVFNTPLMMETANAFMLKEMGGVSIFNELHITHDYRSDRGVARNGYLHFDRLGTFKFFMYLTDCDKDSGAFSYAPGSYKLGKKLRKEAWEKTSAYRVVKNRLEIDYPELGYKSEDAVPIEGPAGTMFAFHSDLFHMGGSVSEFNERRVIRLHLDTNKR